MNQLPKPYFVLNPKKAAIYAIRKGPFSKLPRYTASNLKFRILQLYNFFGDFMNARSHALDSYKICYSMCYRSRLQFMVNELKIHTKQWPYQDGLDAHGSHVDGYRYRFDNFEQIRSRTDSYTNLCHH